MNYKHDKDNDQMNSDNIYDTIIIGGGVSGLGAAIYAGRFKMKTLVLTEKEGGTIMLTNDIANYPGFNKISGMDLADKIRNHAEDYEIDFKTKKVLKIEASKKACNKVYVGEDEYYYSKTIIFATGTEWKKLGVLGEDEYFGKGLHYCALCDAPFYNDKIVAIVGGSDSAVKESVLLAEYAKKVYIIARGKDIRAEPINLERAKGHEKIEIITETNIKEVYGKDGFVTGVILDKEFNSSKDFKLDGLFVAIGHTALSGLAQNMGVELNKKGEIIINRNSETNLKGVYAAGDVTDTRFKQAITGVGEGVTAAYSAYHFLSEENIICICDDDEERS